MESSIHNPDHAPYFGRTCLEDLPSEIKTMILCQMPELSSLSSIVHASPAYHRAYIGAREEILHAMTVRILQEYGIGLLDPWTAIHAPQLGCHIPHRVDNLNGKLERYAQGRMEDSRRRLTPNEALAILSLHRKFTFLIVNYCKDVFSKNPLTESSDDDPPPPSRFELHRLYRALWRYEIYSKFFGPSQDASVREVSMNSIEPLGSPFDEVDIARKFFGLFPVHEVEELACLQKYARDNYFRCGRLQHQLVTLGPEKLYAFMSAASETERWTQLVPDSKLEYVCAIMRDALDAYEREVSWGSWQWRGMYDKFNSERIPTTGWLWASSRGIQSTDFRLRRWGYVFWDQERLHRWGITEEHMVHWPDPIVRCMFDAPGV